MTTLLERERQQYVAKIVSADRVSRSNVQHPVYDRGTNGINSAALGRHLIDCIEIPSRIVFPDYFPVGRGKRPHYAVRSPHECDSWNRTHRSEEHTSELQSHSFIS